ncbi:MAG: hypothetical protein KIS92_14415 [Planctomycetota bacterium]|nr:hypothetical protein [Planctomycetota bacterium]
MASEEAQPSDPGKTEVRLPAISVQMPETHFLALAAVVLFALGCMTVSGSLTEGFSSYDDFVYVVNNKQLHPDAPWSDILFKPHYAQYNPVTIFSYRLNTTFFGPQAAWSFRVVNWLLHVGSGVMLLWLLLHFGLSRWEAFFVAAAWVAHPMACESTVWISERNNVLAFFFGIAAFFAHVRWHGTWKGLILGTLLLLLALLSKPSALNWIPIILAYELLGGPYKLGSLRANSDVGNTAGLGIRMIPLAVLAVSFTFIGMYNHRIGIMPPPGGSVFTAVLTDAVIFARYVFNTLLPVSLSAIYHVEDVESPVDGRFLGCLVLLIGLVAATYYLGRNRRRVILGWVWFFLGCATNANLISISFIMADRYMYIPAAGLLLVLVELAKGVAGRATGNPPAPDGPSPELSAQVRKTLAIAGGAYIAFFGVMAASRSVVWSSTITLFSESVEREPESGIARFYLATSRSISAKVFRDQIAAVELETRIGKRTSADAKKVIDEIRKEEDKANKEIVLLISEGVGKKDVYRYFDVTTMRMMWAQAAGRMGDYAEMKKALEGYLPPPTHPDGPHAGLDEKLIEAGYRAARYKDYPQPYHYRIGTLAECYNLAADAELLAFLDPKTPGAEAKDCLTRSLDFAARAVEAQPNLLNSYVTKAAVYLAQDLLAAKPAAGEDEAARLKAVRELVAKARPAGPYYADEKCESGEETKVAKEVPVERLKAWGYLALSERFLDDAQLPVPEVALAEERANKARTYGERAMEVDPKCYDAFWMLGRVHLQLDALSERKKDLAGSNEHFKKAKDLLSKVPPVSRRYEMVQEMLKTLRPPPPVRDQSKTPESKTEPAKTEEAKTEPAKTEPAKTEEAKSEPAKTEPAKTEEAKTEPAKTEPAKTVEAKSEPAKTEPAKTEEAKTEPAKTEETKTAP